MRSILEKAIVHLLNEEHEQAEALMHKFMVGRARQIHESLREGEDMDDDSKMDDEEVSESYFTEDDLSGLEDDTTDMATDDVASDDGMGDDFGGDDVATDDAGMEAGDDLGGDDMGDDLGDDGMGDDFADDSMGDDVSTDDKIDELTDKLEAFMAQFQELMGDQDVGGDTDGDLGDDVSGDTFADEETMSDDLGDVESDAETVEDDMEGDDMGGDDEEDNFDDITESILADLQKVSVTHEDGKDMLGKAVEQNRKSNLPASKADMKDAAPVKMKQSEHKGFERETPPVKKDIKKFKNNKPRGDDVLTTTINDKGSLLKSKS